MSDPLLVLHEDETGHLETLVDDVGHFDGLALLGLAEDQSLFDGRQHVDASPDDALDLVREDALDGPLDDPRQSRGKKHVVFPGSVEDREQLIQLAHVGVLEVLVRLVQHDVFEQV